MHPLTGEKFGDSVTVVCQVRKPKKQEEDPEKSRLLEDIHGDASKGIAMIDQLLAGVDSESDY